MNELYDEHRLQEQLRLLSKKLALTDKYDAACCGTTVGQCRVLQAIGRNPNVNTKQLAESLNVDKSTMSRTIDHLVKQELIVRRPYQRDRRHTILNFTSEGQVMLKALEMEINKYHAEILYAIPEDKRDQVMESLDLLLRALDKSDLGTCGSSTCC